MINRPRKEVYLEDKLYLVRWYLGTFLGKHWLLHHIRHPDPDRGLHNHPWQHAWAFILKGWYREQRMTGVDCLSGPRIATILRRRFNFNFISGTDAHRISDVSEGGVWTLFVIDKRKHQKWGYLEQFPLNLKARPRRWAWIPYDEMERPVPGYSLHYGTCPLWTDGQEKA